MEYPSSVEEVVADFKARRTGLINALTKDVMKFYMECNPEKDNLCLYGLPNETWEVRLPVDEVPPEVPEPALGINFARDGMQEKDWLSLVAVHCDSWLLSVAFYFGARFGFDKNKRKKLFEQMNSLPTIFEIVSGTKGKEQSSVTNGKRKSSGKTTKSELQSQAVETIAPPEDEDDGTEEGEGEREVAAEEEDEDEQEGTLCGTCGGKYASHEFWIGCDICERWFHGKCVKITAAKAETIKQYKCPFCSTSNKKVRA